MKNIDLGCIKYELEGVGVIFLAHSKRGDVIFCLSFRPNVLEY